MAKVIMTCGKICSGKSTYAQKLRVSEKAVILSVDEITLTLFGGDAGEKHNYYVEQAEKYLFNKSLEIIDIGVNVILDWGFWTSAERKYAKEFYKSKNVKCEFHFIDINNEEWEKRRNIRNEMISRGEISAYFIDEGLAEKCGNFFEYPDKSEIDVWIKK